MENSLELELKINYLRDLWQEFCQAHTELYDVTCNEYLHLMESDMDKLEESVEQKGVIIKAIDKLDGHRQETILEISKLLGVEKLENISQLLSYNEVNPKIKSDVEKLNLILLDIIEKIMEQNKKNQFFLNKAIHSLRELKDSFSGKINYSTYSSTGTTKSSNTY